MSILQSLAFDEICRRRSIRSSDVTLLRGLFLSVDEVSETEIDGLLALDRTCPVQDSSWTDFLSDAVAEFAVNDCDPVGYLTVQNADWLIATLAPRGRIVTRNALATLPKALARARWAPISLITFALDQIRFGVEYGDGPLRRVPTAAGVITKEDCDFAAEIMASVCVDMPAAMTTAELVKLLEIDRLATVRPLAWTALLQTLVAASIVAASGYRVMDRRTLLGLRQFQGVQFVGPGETAHLGALKRLAAYRANREDLMLIGLERQRISIITGEPFDELTSSILKRLMHDARPELLLGLEVLADAGIEISFRFNPDVPLSHAVPARAASPAAVGEV